MNTKRIAIIDGVRTAMGKAGGLFNDINADDLGVYPIKELIRRNDSINVNDIDQVIIGNVSQPVNAANIARVIALKAGLPEFIPAFSVHRNCASGMQAITSGAMEIMTGKADIVVAGGVESMSNIPLLFRKKMTDFIAMFMKSRTVAEKIKVISSFRLNFLKPVVGLVEGLTDPVAEMIMGCTAENLVKEFKITREKQDLFSLNSHKLAEKATKENILREEIIPIYSPKTKNMIDIDEGIRFGQNIESLKKLKPYFEKNTGTVTVGNSSQITDGAAAVILASEAKVKELGIEPLGYIRDFDYAGLQPQRMGLGPAFATAKLLKKTGVKLSDIDLIEINEAFASQVIANEIAFASKEFAKNELNENKAIGEIDKAKLNVNGGAIALGHPVGMTGTRIVITILKELHRRKKNLGLATLCIGGGQGGAVLLEVK